MQKKDKQKVLDEVWTEERIKSFLDLEAPADTDTDFHTLYTAYKSMRLDDFQIFLKFFSEAGRNFNASNKTGENLLSLVSNHHHGKDYAEALQKYL